MRIAKLVTTGISSLSFAAAGVLVLFGSPAGSAAEPAQQVAVGHVVGWGSNPSGQVGMGSTTGPDTCDAATACATSPNALVGLRGVKGVSAGQDESAAVLTNGTVMAWGSNASGGLGDGSTTGPEDCPASSTDGCSGTPVAVPGLSGVKQVASGDDFDLALLSNGTVEAWGKNDVGQLGDGTLSGPDFCAGASTPCSTSPVAVTGLSGVKKIAAGSAESVALLTNGTIMVWGGNGNGLGNGSTESDVPVPLSGLTNVKQVACGQEGTCLALIKGGTVMAWGRDTGSASTPTSATPIAVPGLNGVSQVAAGEVFNMALLKNGTVEAWGSNVAGDLGNGTTGGSSTTPVLIPHLSGVTAVAAGTSSGEALLSSGRVKTWGLDDLGELGDGSTASTDVPAKIPGLSGVKAISTSTDHTLAMG